MITLAQKEKILLVQLIAFGDCLYVTSVARQIKRDHPGCHLTWAISPVCRPLLIDNPDVDAVLEIPAPTDTDYESFWKKLRQDFDKEVSLGHYQRVVITQIVPLNIGLYDGSIRGTHYAGYDRPIQNVQPVLRLTKLERGRAEEFVKANGLEQGTFNVILEAAPNRGQSFLNLEAAQKIARELTDAMPDCRVIISSIHAFQSENPAIIDGSVLTFRENAALSHHCHLLLGGSSGITWLLTSEAAKKIPSIQLVNSQAVWMNSLCVDHQKWGLNADHVIELTEGSREKILPCLKVLKSNGVAEAKRQFHEEVKPNPFAFEFALQEVLRKGEVHRFVPMCVRMIKSGFSPWQVFVSGIRAASRHNKSRS